MIRTTALSRTRCLLVWLAVTGAAGLLVLLVSSDLAPTEASFEAWLVAAAAWALCAAGSWASAVTGLVALQVLCDAPVRVRGLPTPARHALLRACGVAATGTLAAGLTVGVAAGPSLATPGSLERDRPTPTPTPAATSATSATPATPTASTAAPREVVVVRPGDSLWRVTEGVLARRLGRAPDVAEVAAAWPRLHAANRVLVGPDPHLVRPGVPLTIPSDLSPTTDRTDRTDRTEES